MVWKPKNFEEACKRQAGRRKYHIKLRQKRAERVAAVLALVAEMKTLRDGDYGTVSYVADEMGVSLPTASRDVKLCRRMLIEFFTLFLREFKNGTDRVVWIWDYSAYGFVQFGMVRENLKQKEIRGRYPFTTRSQ